MKVIFSAIVFISTTLISISLLPPPPPLTSDARAVTSVTISTIRNSCIVNNANIAVQNINNTPLDAINNWWGMPTGATHDNIPSGDAVGQNVLYAPHLSTMPFLCDLTSADWIPFSEQELQYAINSHIPHLGGIAFALIDFEWGRGAKFDILTHPNYGNLHGVAYISIKPNPTGDLITLQLDITRLPTDETIQKIVTCELMPLFVNSLQQVQNRYVSPSQSIASMVVMERDLMMRFTPPTEITPEPASEFVLNYDASCLPEPIVVPMPTPSPTPPQNEDESGMLVSIPPLEGEFTLLETGTMQQSQSNIIFLDVDTTVDDISKQGCSNELDDCSLRGAITQARNNPTQEYAILIPNGTYRLTQNIIIEGKVSLIGLEAYTGSQFAGAVITQDGTVLNTLITIRNINSNQKSIAYLYNLNIRGGRGYSSAMLNIHGSDVYIYDSRFEDNYANGYGGAIKVNDSFAPTSFVEIKNTVFEDNQAYMGGAILGEQGIGSIRLECVTFKNNHAGLGGAIATYYGSFPYLFNGTISIDNSNFIMNTSNNGGAIHRQDGTITIGDNHWTPNANATPTASNSVVGMTAPLPNGLGEFPLDCEIDEPPRKVVAGVCSVLSTNNGFNIRNSPRVMDNNISFAFSGDEAPVNLIVKGRQRGIDGWDWYYVGSSKGAGWVRSDLLNLNPACNIRDYIPLVDNNGNLLTTISLNDYPLPEPPSDWINSLCDDTDDTLAGCAKVVYFVYYHVFEQIYNRPPKLSDVLTSIYQLELESTSRVPAIGINRRATPAVTAYELAQETLAQNYWVVCGDRQNTSAPYYYNCTSRTDPLDLAEAYLYQIQAWYGKGLSLRALYTNHDIQEFQSISDLETERRQYNSTQSQYHQYNNMILLLPKYEHRFEGIDALNKSRIPSNSIPWQWGNYGYNADSGTPYEVIYIREGFRVGGLFLNGYETKEAIVLCVKNIDHVDSNENSRPDRDDYFADDIFVLITVRNLGQSSVASEFIPPWNQIPDSYFNGESLSCARAKELEG